MSQKALTNTSKKSCFGYINKIIDKEDVLLEQIKAENIQISRKELLLKEHILKGNEYFYKKEYIEVNLEKIFDKMKLIVRGI